MSHYAVMIIGDDVERQLAPYQENNMGDCPKEFLEFTEDEDMEIDEETGKKGFWENPNSKWDWYSVGGRWAGHLLIKPEFQSLYDEQEPNFSHGWDRKSKAEVLKQCKVDSALKGHVDFEGMMNEAGEAAAKTYDAVMKLIGHFPPNETWDAVRDEKNVDASREKYWAQPRCAAWKKADHKKLDEAGADSFFGSPDHYLCTREQYISLARRKAVSVFAFVQDGKWAEKGSMGWWGHVSNENDAWPDVFAKLLESVPDTERLTIVDCHI